MSIIHEALKKVQSNRSATSAEQTISQPVKPIPLAAEKPKSPPHKLGWEEGLWAIFILGLASFTFFHLFDLSKNLTELRSIKPAKLVITALLPPPSVSTSNPSTPTPAAPTPPVPPVVDKAKRQPGEIMLYGITVMDGKKYALLNDGIYEVGDEILGAQLTAITAESVTLEKQGIPKTLKVIHK